MSGRYDYGGPGNRAERGAAMLNYVFLIISPVTLGFLAVIALVFAYARRGAADELTRTHYTHQIKNFWHDFLILILGLACAVGAIAGGIGSIAGFGGISLWDGINPGETAKWAIGLAIAWLLLWVWGFLGLFIGSVRGALRLARGRPIGH